MKPMSFFDFVLTLIALLSLILLAGWASAQPVHAQGISMSGPRPTAEQSAEILRKGPGLSNWTYRRFYEEGTGPTVTVIPDSTPHPPMRDTRLDGTPWTSPPAVYGMPQWWLPWSYVPPLMPRYPVTVPIRPRR